MGLEAIKQGIVNTYPLPELSDDDVLIRAREAFIANHRFLPRFVRRGVRAGWYDSFMKSTIAALRDVKRPLHFVIADRDEATCALIMHHTPGLAGLALDEQRAVSAALMTAIRMGRRG